MMAGKSESSRLKLDAPCAVLNHLVQEPRKELVHKLGAMTTQPSQAQSLVQEHQGLKKLLPLLVIESSLHQELVSLCFQLSKSTPEEDAWLWSWFDGHPLQVNIQDPIWFSWIHMLLDRVHTLSDSTPVERVMMQWLKSPQPTMHLLKLALIATQDDRYCHFIHRHMPFIYSSYSHDTFHPLLNVLFDKLDAVEPLKEKTRQWIITAISTQQQEAALGVMRGLAVCHHDWVVEWVQQMSDVIQQCVLRPTLCIWKWVYALIGFKLVRPLLMDFLSMALEHSLPFIVDIDYDPHKHFPLFVILKWCAFDPQLRTRIPLDKLMQFNLTLLTKNIDVSIETLVYLSGSPGLRCYFDHPDFYHFLVYSSQQTQMTMGMAYHLVIILHHLSSFKRLLSEEEKQVKELRKFAKQDEDEDEEEDALVEKRVEKMIKKGAVGVLNLVWKVYKQGSHSDASHTTTARSLSTSMALTFQNLSQPIPTQGELVQQGALKTVLNMIETYWPGPPLKKLNGEADLVMLACGQCLARLAIRLNPELAFREEMRGTLIVSMVYLLLPGTFGLYQFEALMALTNIMSLQQGRLVQLFHDLGGIPLLEDVLMDQNDMVRRAAVELVCNLLGWDDKWKNPKWLRLWSCYCDEESQDMRRAASGCLATMISEPDVLEYIASDDKGLKRLLKLLDEQGSLKYDIWHRAFEIWKWLLNTKKQHILQQVPELPSKLEHLIRKEAHILQQQRPDILSIAMEILLGLKR